MNSCELWNIWCVVSGYITFGYILHRIVNSAHPVEGKPNRKEVRR